MNPVQEIWRWVLGDAGRAFATAGAVEEPIRWLLKRAQRKGDAGVLDVLRSAAGGSGIGHTEEQIAGQSGTEPRKLKAALRRLRKAGKVRESDGRWYVTGSGEAGRGIPA